MVCFECECWTYINCIMSAVLWVGPYHRSVMESFHLELVWVMASFFPEQNMGRAASFSVYHCPVGQSLDPSSPATIKNPLKGAPVIVTVNLKQINRFKKAHITFHLVIWSQEYSLFHFSLFQSIQSILNLVTVSIK